MKILVIRLILLVLMVYMAYATEDPDSILHFADYLVKKGEPRSAITEYKRYQCYPGADTCLSNFQIAVALQKLNKYSKSSEKLEHVIDECESNPNIVIKAHIALVKDCILQEKYRLGQFELNQIRQYPEAASHQDEIHYLDILLDAHLYQIDSAMKKIGSTKPKSPYKKKIGQIAHLMPEYKQKHFKRPFFAFWLSTFIPGAGQLYVGKKRHALFAFSLVSALSTAMAWSGYRYARGDRQEKYIASADFITFGLFVWHRYYDGSRKNAYESAVYHNQAIQLKYQNRLRRIEDF